MSRIKILVKVMKHQELEDDEDNIATDLAALKGIYDSMVRDLLKRRSFLPTEFHSKEFVKEYEKLEEKRVDSNDVDVNSLASAMSSLRIAHNKDLLEVRSQIDAVASDLVWSKTDYRLLEKKLKLAEAKKSRADSALDQHRRFLAQKGLLVEFENFVKSDDAKEADGEDANAKEDGRLGEDADVKENDRLGDESEKKKTVESAVEPKQCKPESELKYIKPSHNISNVRTRPMDGGSLSEAPESAPSDPAYQEPSRSSSSSHSNTSRSQHKPSTSVTQDDRRKHTGMHGTAGCHLDLEAPESGASAHSPPKSSITPGGPHEREIPSATSLSQTGGVYTEAGRVRVNEEKSEMSDESDASDPPRATVNRKRSHSSSGNSDDANRAASSLNEHASPRAHKRSLSSRAPDSIGGTHANNPPHSSTLSENVRQSHTVPSSSRASSVSSSSSVRRSSVSQKRAYPQTSSEGSSSRKSRKGAERAAPSQIQNRPPFPIPAALQHSPFGVDMGFGVNQLRSLSHPSSQSSHESQESRFHEKSSRWSSASRASDVDISSRLDRGDSDVSAVSEPRGSPTSDADANDLHFGAPHSQSCADSGVLPSVSSFLDRWAASQPGASQPSASSSNLSDILGNDELRAAAPVGTKRPSYAAQNAVFFPPPAIAHGHARLPPPNSAQRCPPTAYGSARDVDDSRTMPNYVVPSVASGLKQVYHAPTLKSDIRAHSVGDITSGMSQEDFGIKPNTRAHARKLRQTFTNTVDTAISLLSDDDEDEDDEDMDSSSSEDNEEDRHISSSSSSTTSNVKSSTTNFVRHNTQDAA